MRLPCFGRFRLSRGTSDALAREIPGASMPSASIGVATRACRVRALLLGRYNCRGRLGGGPPLRPGRRRELRVPHRDTVGEALPRMNEDVTSVIWPQAREHLIDRHLAAM